jgi:hypothetical protein
MNEKSTDAQKPICGIIMPISYSDDDHTAEHWENVRHVIEVAIEKTGLFPQPVWQNGDFDVIQARILKNLFENEIIVCDISTRNPNVMLEFGMRLTTKKPTIVIAEKGTPLPFDTSVINTEFYDHSLDYVSTAEFIARLAKAIADTRIAVGNGTYHAYLEHFRFETVEPATISVTADKRIEARLDEIISRLKRSENSGDLFFESVIRQDPPLKLGDPNMIIGARVTHQKFGEGAIVEKDGNKLEIDFDDVGRRRVMDSFVDLLKE